jgi:4-hydroxybenzoate polyprenyltransferase
MRTLSGLARLTRIGIWISVELLLFAAIGLILQFSINMFIRYLAYAALLLCFGYGVNNFFDRWQDARSGKQYLYPHNLSRRTVISTLVLCGIGALVLAYTSFGLFGLLVASINLAFALSYSMPPLRFKERGWLALPVIGLAQFSLPLVVVTVGSGKLHAAAGLWLWLLVYGMADVLLHQLEDLSSDERAGVDTLTSRLGSVRVRPIVIICALVQLCIAAVVSASADLVVGGILLALFTAGQLKEVWFSKVVSPRGRILRLAGVCRNRCRFCEYLGNRSSVQRIAGNPKRVIIGGCEPVASASFEQTVQDCAPASIELMTTARPFVDNALLERTMQLGIRDYLVYLFGHTAAVHDRVANCPGSFRETLAGLDNLRRRKINLSFYLILNGKNYQYLDDIIVFSRKYRPAAIHVRVVGLSPDTDPIPEKDLFSILARIRKHARSDQHIRLHDHFMRCGFLTTFLDNIQHRGSYDDCITCPLVRECERIK